MNPFRKLFSGKRPAFYAATATAALSLLSAILYAALYGGGELMNWACFVLPILGMGAFFTLSFFEMPRIGSAVLAALDFTALLVFLYSAYQDLWDYLNDLLVHGTTDGSSSELSAFVTVTVFLLVCFVAANVCAWLKLKRQPAEEVSHEEAA